MDHPIPATLPDWPSSTVRDLIRHSVAAEISAYRKRQAGDPPSTWLDLPGLQQALDRGKVRFGALDVSPPDIDGESAQRAALEAFQDRIILIFVDGRKIGDLGEILALTPRSTVRYLKLAALRGR